MFFLVDIVYFINFNSKTVCLSNDGILSFLWYEIVKDAVYLSNTSKFKDFNSRFPSKTFKSVKNYKFSKKQHFKNELI